MYAAFDLSNELSNDQFLELIHQFPSYKHLCVFFAVQLYQVSHVNSLSRPAFGVLKRWMEFISVWEGCHDGHRVDRIY